MVSPRRTSSAISFIPEESNKMMPSSTKSCESLYSNTSSSKGSAAVLYRKNPPMGHRQPAIIPATTEVRQRVLSARRLRMKTYQNQLADAQQTISDLAHENRILRTLHKRQDSALAKYESTNAELPQLLHSHAEELRVWQAKYRNLQATNKDLEHKIKQKEAMILSLSDQNKHYSQLNKDKNLDERQRLSEKLHTLESSLQDKDNDIKLMARKMQLEAKNFKKQIQQEQKKYKDIVVKLEKTRLELSGYRKLDELNFDDKYPNIVLRRKDQEPKIDKTLEPLLENDNQTADADSNYLASNRSTKSSSADKLELKSTHAMRNLCTKTTAISSPIKQAQRRIDRGDGDAAAISENQISTVSQKKNKNEQKPKSPQYNDDYELSEDLDEDSADTDPIVKGHEEVEEVEDDDDDISNQEELDGDSNNADKLIDGESDGIADVIACSKNPSKMQEDISIIRKKISADFKEREAFLDTFCRQATSTSLREEPIKRNTDSVGRNIPNNNRKHKLLAALKAINDNQSEE